MYEKKVTIIVPIYNAKNTIEQCVKSIIKQTYKNLQIILINDGSTDDTFEICKKLELTDSRILLIDKENEKVSKTRNKGLELAEGEYLMFVDSDDSIQENMIEILVKNIEEYELCTCNYLIVKKKKKVIRSKVKSFHNEKNKFNNYIELMEDDMLFNPLWNKIYLTKVIKENNIRFNPNIQVGEDFLFNIEYIDNIQRAKYIEQPLYLYNIFESSLCRRYTNRNIQNELIIIRTLKEFYKKNNYNMKYVWNKSIDLIKSNVENLFVGNKDKKEIIYYIDDMIKQMEKEELLCENQMCSRENKMLFNIIKKENIKLIYKYLKIRYFVKTILRR